MMNLSRSTRLGSAAGVLTTLLYVHLILSESYAAAKVGLMCREITQRRTHWSVGYEGRHENV